MSLCVPPKDGDWTGIRKGFRQISRALEDYSFYNLTASRLLSTSTFGKPTTVSDLTTWVAGTANQITVTDDSDGTVTLSAPQDIHTGASPTFANVILANGGTVGQASGPLLTFNDTSNYLTLTGCRVGINTSTPLVPLQVLAESGSSQFAIFANSDISYGGSPAGTHIQFSSGATTGNTHGIIQVWNTGGTAQGDLYLQAFGGDVVVPGITTTGTVDASAGEVLVEDNDTSEPTGKSDGYVGVATIGGTSRIYFTIGGLMYYVDGTVVAATPPITGNPIGLLLTLTYDIP